VEGLAVGNNVVVEPYFVDGDCDMCGAGSYHLCRQMGFIGISGGGGGLSEKIVVDKRWVHPDGDIPLDEAALIKPLSVAHHAVARSGAKAGDVALVGGCDRCAGRATVTSEPREQRRHDGGDKPEPCSKHH
jgi:(R,R)-butanediol dehydrogenase/meso-butanediol dehydrogenase/diacetyl reductase